MQTENVDFFYLNTQASHPNLFTLSLHLVPHK